MNYTIKHSALRIAAAVLVSVAFGNHGVELISWITLAYLFVGSLGFWLMDIAEDMAVKKALEVTK